MKTEHAAYLAGLFDGEGCVAFYHRVDRKGRDYFQFQAKITNTDVRLLEFVVTVFGGNIVKEGKPPRGNRRQCFVWYVCNKKAEEFFQAIRPFTICKSDQIDEVLAVRRTFVRRRGKDGRNLPVPDNVVHLRLASVSRLKSMKRGAG